MATEIVENEIKDADGNPTATPGSSSRLSSGSGSGSGSSAGSSQKKHGPISAEELGMNSGRFLPNANTNVLRAKPNLFKLLGLAAMAAGLIWGGYTWWQQASSVVETDDAYITGRIHQLSSRVSGTVTAVNVEDNQHVKAGEILVKIDPTDLEISAKSAQAAALKAQLQASEAESALVADNHTADAEALSAESAQASARAQVDKAKAALAAQIAGVEMARAQIVQRQAELDRAAADYTRYASLVEDRAVTEQSFEKARQDKEVAQANLQAAQESFKQSQLQVQEAKQAVVDAQAGLIRAQSAIQQAAAAKAEAVKATQTIAVQKAAILQAKADQDNAVTQLSYTNVAAPVAGKIGHRTVEVGQQIERGQALMSIVSDDKWVVANFKETQLNGIRPGQPVEIKIDSFPGKVFTGRVDSFSPASGAQFTLLPPDNATGNFTKVVQRIAVKIVFDKNSIKGYEDLISPGMSVIPEIHIKH